MRKFWMSYAVIYREAEGDDALHEAIFGSEADARAWADAQLIAPLYIEVRQPSWDAEGGSAGSEVAERIEY